jgi:CheY-like chemotaxis protein
VDDEPLFRRSLRAMVDRIEGVRQKVSVAEASHGEEALDLFAKTRFDLVIADVMMGPGRMDGFEFTLELLWRYPNKSVLIHSNVSLQNGRTRARQAGAVDFLPKPMTERQLLNFLVSGLERAERVPRPKEKTSGGNVSVGILDDNLLMRKGYRTVLHRVLKPLEGYEVHDFEKPQRLNDHLKAHPLDVLFLDVDLGAAEPDGLTLASSLKKLHPDMNIVIVTNLSRARVREQAEPGSFDLMLSAPLDEDGARQALQKYLKS